MCKIKIIGNIEAFGVKMAVHLGGWMDVWIERYIYIYMPF
jgi:hypothetical protein